MLVTQKLSNRVIVSTKAVSKHVGEIDPYGQKNISTQTGSTLKPCLTLSYEKFGCNMLL